MAHHSGELLETELRVSLLTNSQTGAIDDVYRAVSKSEDPEAQAEGKKIIEKIATLKYEILHDRQLTYGPST